MRSLDQLPPFSPVLNRLLASLADEEVSLAEIAGLIERDTVLSANVLRMVNSALYGRRGTVSSVRAAVSILGLLRIRNVAIGLSVGRMWGRLETPRSWNMERFNAHSAAVAVLSDLLVQQVETDYAEGAFAGGLLHDLGRLMIATSLPDEYEQIQAQRLATGHSEENLEFALLEVTHPELSAAALSKWNLPVPIQRAVLYHHQPELDPARARGRTLSQVLHAANVLACHFGYGMLEGRPLSTGAEASALEALGWTGRLEDLEQDFESEFSAYRSSLNS
jgi:HD-like signal output (HDOD) protein